MASQEDLLNEYLEMLGILMNTPVESGTTNPSISQLETFPGPFLEEKSPVKDIYEYEKILLSEDENAINTTTDEKDDTPTTTRNRITRPTSGY